jgi:branched-chain amino acid transport system ATP-binding protein
MSEPILAIRNLEKSFGALRASNSIFLDVIPGEFRAIIGPNGAGKSTFFNLVSGFLKPDSGQIIFAGNDITGWQPYRLFRAGLSRTFQITSIFADLTVIENLQLVLLSAERRIFNPYLSSSRMRLQECERLLELVELDVEHGRPAGTLSHGDQKKLELAVALANEPRLLLLDEPTAGMAVNERLDSIRIVHRIAKKAGVTVVFTEHDMQVVFDVSDRISVLHQGTIIADDVPDKVRESERVQQVYLGDLLEAAT